MMKGYVASMNPEQRMSFAREQIHIALANAVNGAKSLGMDSCPMGGFILLRLRKSCSSR